MVLLIFNDMALKNTTEVYVSNNVCTMIIASYELGMNKGLQINYNKKNYLSSKFSFKTEIL